MKRLFVLAALAVFTCSFAYAEDMAKVGFVDLQRALNESEVGKKAKAELEGMVKMRQAIIDEKVKQREQKEQDFQKQSMALSEKARAEKQEELKKMERDIKRLIDDSNTEMQKTQREKERDILKGFEAVIERIGKEQGYTLIVPSDVVLYGREGTDLTDALIKIYNESPPLAETTKEKPKEEKK
jgi:outer membrane protein